MTLAGFFGHTAHVTWWQECTRTLVIFFYGLLLVRIAGRRVFGRWSAIDIIVSVIIGSSLSRAMTGNANLGGTLATTTLLMALHWMLARVAAHVPWFARLIEGTAIHLARDGKPQRLSLLHDSVSDQDLQEALRQSGVESVADTRLVVLEPSGRITVLKNRG